MLWTTGPRTSRASRTVNIYFQFLYLTRITKHNHTHLKPPKNQNRRAGDGPHKPLAFDQILVHLFLLFVFNLTNKILFKPKQKSRFGTVALLGGGGGGLQLGCGRSTLALSSAMVPQTLSCRFLAHRCIILETKKSKSI